jgi:hypothetical protein
MGEHFREGMEVVRCRALDPFVRYGAAAETSGAIDFVGGSSH